MCSMFYVYLFDNLIRHLKNIYILLMSVTGENMNAFLNDNWKEILSDLQSGFEKALATAFLEVAQQFFSRVPFNQVFQD